MLEFKSKVLKLKVDDVECVMKFPSVKRIAEYKKAMKEDGFDDTLETVKLFVELGMPQEIADSLDIDAFNAIVKTLTGAEKK